MNLRFAIGLVLGFGIGFGCRWAGVPSPAPPAFVGALIVFTMTLGYVVCDRWLARREAKHATECGGPTGQTRRSP